MGEELQEVVTRCCTHSSVSFLLSILTMTSLSSLAFSSLEEKKRSQPPLAKRSPLLHATALSLHQPVERRGFVSSHGHQLGKQVRSGDAGVGGVNWESLHQRGTWERKQYSLVSLGEDHQNPGCVAAGPNLELLPLYCD